MRLFYPGLNDIRNYRIPSLLTTSKGTVIAGADARVVTSSDNPNEIHIVVRRSEDSGETFSKPILVVKYPGEGLDGASALDSCLLEDKKHHRIWLLLTHTPGGVGLFNSQAGTGFDNGRKILQKENGNYYFLDKSKLVCAEDGSELDAPNESGYFENGSDIYSKRKNPEELKEYPTSFLQLVYSEDEGETWSEPEDLNEQVKEEWMTFIGAGPGRGIQLEQGNHCNRLIFPIYIGNEYGLLSSSLIYSDDFGATWTRGVSPNDGRKIDNKLIDCKLKSNPDYCLTESQLVSLSDGRIKWYLRNHLPNKCYVSAESNDGGETFSNLKLEKKLVDPISQASVISFESHGKKGLMFSNAFDPEIRQNGTVRISWDDGESWSESFGIHPEGFGYSCLTQLTEDTFGILYENIVDHNQWIDMELEFKRFTLDDFK